MAKTRSGSTDPESLAAQLKSLATGTEVLRLIDDVTTCSLEWTDYPASIVPPQARGLELFPCFSMYFQRHLVEVQGYIYPNLVAREWEGQGELSHVSSLGPSHGVGWRDIGRAATARGKSSAYP